ncbi:MAG: hypothetical protein C0466_03400 [Candidatus Accumulibacter sp.]|nr:hypothetical protein [Accumulibacter sp.]
MRNLTPTDSLPRQQGLTLIIVLIALVSLSLAAVALIRSVDTASLVLGNLGFKQGTTSTADRSAETASAWLLNKLNSSPTDLYDSRCVSGCATQDSTTAYYATSLDALDISGHSTAATRVLLDWDGNGCAYAASGSYAGCLKVSPAVSANGFTTNYVVARMCKTTGDPNASSNNCAQPTSAGSANLQINKGETKYGGTTMLKGGGGGSGGILNPQMFRIIVRSKGPRNTVSYTETFVSAIST